MEQAAARRVSRALHLAISTMLLSSVVCGGTVGAPAAFALPEAAVAPAASAAPVCAGDCNNDRMVTIDELLRMIGIALGSNDLSTCPNGNPTQDGRITIDEILMAVSEALNGCPAVTSPDLERAAGVVNSTLVALISLLTDVPVLTDGGGAASRSPATRARLAALHWRPVTGSIPAGGAAAPDPCPGGGEISASCQEIAGSTTITGWFSNCRMPDEASGLVITANGGFVIVVASLGVCDTGVIPVNVRLSTQFNGFTATYADGIGTVITSVSLPTYTEAIDPLGVGCAGPNGTYSLQGAFSVVTPSAAIDLSGTAFNLVLQLASSGTPCMAHVTGTGSLALNDTANWRRFFATFPGTQATLMETLVPTMMLGTLDGPLQVDCLGNISVATDVPLLLPGGACPLDGRLAVGLADGTTGRVRFTAGGGVEFDYDGNGTVDKAVAECHDLSLSQCR